MSSVLKKSPDAPENASTSIQIQGSRAWITHWELYLILLVAAFLRLYRIDMTEFNADQADIFQMAHNAVSHAHLVATSNIASIGIFNPPGIIYFLMLAAIFSANPLAGAVLTAILSTLAVFLTYIIGCRYYGRLAGAIAASLFAAAAAPIFYSRFMWNQNLLLFFVPLFIGVLLYGVIERRKGWFAPAVVLVGLLAQLHGSGFLLAAPLVVAFILAPGTVRIRDVVLGALAFFVLYSTYLLWLVHSHYRDITIFLMSIRHPATIDNQALVFFMQFLSPYGFDPNNVPLTNPHSLLFRFSGLLLALALLMAALAICSAIMALVVALRTEKARRGLSGERKAGLAAIWQWTAGWWVELRASPYRCALWVLLSWQLVPLVYLLRHSIKLHSHYFIMLMPGPFLLCAIFIVKVIDWTKLRAAGGRMLRLCMYGLTVCLVAAQLLGGLALVLDTVRGNFNADYNRFNDLHTLQNALGEADQLAQQRHLSHVYVSTDDIRRSAFYYLSEQMHTPTTVFDNSCAILPGFASGPVALLAGPKDDITTALAENFARVTLVDRPARLSDIPFRLYIVAPLPQQAVRQEILAPDLQSLGAKKSFPFQNNSWLITHWELLRSQPPSSGTTYTYRVTEGQNAQQSQCTSTSTRAGDQLLIPLLQSTSHQGLTDVKVQAFATRPDTLSIHLGNIFVLNFDTYNRVDTPHTTLQTATGAKTIPV